MDAYAKEQIEKLFKKAQKYNWDDGYEWLYEVVQSKFCDKGTILMIYWLSRPEWFCQYASQEEVQDYELENYKFIKFVEKIYPTITLEHIIYDPCEDKQVDMYKNIITIKQPLPACMYEKTLGNIHFKSL